MGGACGSKNRAGGTWHCDWKGWGHTSSGSRAHTDSENWGGGVGGRVLNGSSPSGAGATAHALPVLVLLLLKQPQLGTVLELLSWERCLTADSAVMGSQFWHLS